MQISKCVYKIGANTFFWVTQTISNIGNQFLHCGNRSLHLGILNLTAVSLSQANLFLEWEKKFLYMKTGARGGQPAWPRRLKFSVDCGFFGNFAKKP